MKKSLILGSLSLSLLVSSTALADTYDPGTLIIPMDTTYQDSGMLKAYGLVYELLRSGIPVDWAIRKGKAYGGTDFTASATPYPSGSAVTAHGYRGGPWLVDAVYADSALPIIATWKSQHTTTVHVATTSFDVDIARRLVAAPTIAMFADGNQDIARGYMQAAGIPDSTLNYAWPNTSPDMLDPNEVAGPTTSNHSDGKLFDADGDPAYCQLMSMHWGVADARAKPEVVAEVRSFLGHPTHFFAECQAVNAYENDPVNGHFLTPNGFLIASKPSAVDFYNPDYPFAQLDGPFKTTGGSEPAYSLPAQDVYKDSGIVMLTTRGSPVGVGDVWMTGYLDGACSIEDDGEGQDEACHRIGKVSYLGGHEYDTDVPLSTHGGTQGTRLFLNSLFEAPCATVQGQPDVYLANDAPATTTIPQLTFTLTYENEGPTTALAVVLRDAIPAGSTFVSATGGGTFSNGVVSWDLQNLGDGELGSVSFTVLLGSHGVYENQAFLDYHVGLNSFTYASGTTSTLFDDDTDGDGFLDSDDICPNAYNPTQNLSRDVQSCGSCGTVCSAANGVPRCSSGVCSIASCDAGYSDCDRTYGTGCEYANSGFPSDEANCGACGQVCSPSRSTGACVGGNCTIGTCNTGFADCDGIVGDGCEYDTDGFQSDRNHCGDCTTQCGANEICQSGSCVPSPCPAGTADCVAPAGDCETPIVSNTNHCGGCGLACAPPNATGSCVSSSCALGPCDAGYSDCNGLAGDGCEYENAAFENDLNHCGGCGSTCAPENGSGTCAAGVCTIAACAPGYSDCNGLENDGCEYEDAGFESDPSHCGGCGSLCAPANAIGSCELGTCGIESCVAGHVNLDGDDANGCETECTQTGELEIDCDGIDDDCDGLVDEEHMPTSCGVGACTASSRCLLGVETCTPATGTAEGPAGSPSCADGADNDCDGAADDDDNECEVDAPNGSGGAAEPNAGGAAGEPEGTAARSNGATGGAGGATGGSSSSSSGEGGDPGSAGNGSAGEPGEAVDGGATGGGEAGHGGSGAGNSAAGSAGHAQGVAGNSADQTGGCGCRVGAQPRSGLASPAMLVLLALTGLRRRRSVRREVARRAA